MAALVNYNFTLNDTSPMIQYSPLSDGSDASQGWKSVYESETGSSYHITSMANASLSISFFGTGITLFGTTNAPYDAFLGSNKDDLPSYGEDILYDSNSLELDHYNVQINVGSTSENQFLRFNNATVTSEVFGRSRYPEIKSLDSDDDLMDVHGNWRAKTQDNQFPLDSHSNVTVRATRAPGDNLSFSFRGRAVAIYGPVNTSSGLFSVMHGHDVHVVNASSSIPIDETVLFYKDGLHESNTTTLHVTNLGTGETVFCMSRVQVFSFNSTNSTTSTWTSNPAPGGHRVLIIGAIVGSIVGTVLLVATVLILMKTRRKRRDSASSGPNAIIPFEVGVAATGNAITGSESKESSSSESNRDESNMVVLPDNTGPQIAVSSVSLSTVERMLLLIARHVDSVTRPGDGVGDQERRSLPPYPASIRNRSSRAAT